MYLDRWILAGKLPPHRILPIKGSIHVAINRQFVDFALHDNRSIDFLEWLKNTDIPDETFFSSLNHNPHLGINGSFLGKIALISENNHKPIYLIVSIMQIKYYIPFYRTNKNRLKMIKSVSWTEVIRYLQIHL